MELPPSSSPSPQVTAETITCDLLVVGAGPSGLAYGLGAQQAVLRADRALELRVLEAAPRTGGWVHTRHVGDRLLETGPYGYLDKHPELGRIVSLLGLESRVQLPAPAAVNRYVFTRGRLRRMPRGPLSFLFSRILTLRGKLRLLREPWAAGPPGGDESVTDFATRRLGREAAESLVVPMFTGIYAGDPDRASLAACFPRMAELEREFGGLFRALWRLRRRVRRAGQGVGAPRGKLTSFGGGLSTLMESLSARVGDGLHLESEVVRLERHEGGYVATTTQGERFRASRVVLALPAHRAATVVAPLGGGLQGLLQRIPYAGVTVVHTAYALDQARRVPRGFGFLIPRAARRDLLGAVFVSTIFPDSAPRGELLLRNVLGGRLRPELLELDDQDLLDRVRAEHRELLGLQAEPTFVDITRYPGSLPQYQVGHGSLLADLDAELETFPGLSVTGNALRGIGLADCLAQNFSRGERDFGPRESP